MGEHGEPAQPVSGRLTAFVLAQARNRSVTGFFLALGALAVSLAPSLLPRTWLLQAVASALSALVVYAVGAAVGAGARALAGWGGVSVRVDPQRRRRLWLLAGVVALGISVGGWLAGHRGRVHTAYLVGARPPSWATDAAAFLGAVALCVVLLVLLRMARAAFRASRFVLALAMPRWVAGLLALVLVVSLGGWLTRSVVGARLLESASASAARVDESVPEDVTEPASPLVSGGPGSLVRWSDLGMQGKVFTGSALTREQIQQVTGHAVAEPIRVYAGPTSEASSFEEISRTAVAELRRTGAFERSTLVLVGTTGTGWIDRWSIQPLEYLTGGDCASVAIQYSYLPSPLQFVTNRTGTKEAGRAFVHTVLDAVRAIPEQDRPKTYLVGESLGAYALDAAFDSPEQLLSSVDGAVFIGPPSSTRLRRQFTAERQRGSPQIAPVIDHGRHVRFATRPEDLRSDLYGRPLGEWQEPRVVYLQYASDPIVWWGPSLAWRQPDWIREAAGRDVDPHLRWWPLVTFFQVTLDLSVGMSTPAGHGHTYQQDLVDCWAAVLDEPLTGQRRTEIVAAVRQRR